MHKPLVGFVYSHTHWDIEWYQPFRSFRFWLADMLDSVRQLLERDPAFRRFVLDGQVAPVDQYLEIKPEHAARIRRLIAARRLAIGPFYTQFDEWLASPEAIIRNALYGLRRGRALGGVMRAGYLPDNFGHPRQMPQILAGLGLDSLIFMRGMPDKPAGMGDEFYWEGLDGTRIFCVHQGEAGGYGRAGLPGIAAVDLRRPIHLTPYGDVFHGYELYRQCAATADPEQGARQLIALARQSRGQHPSGVIPLANGYDHAPPLAAIGRMIRRANALQKDIHFVHGDCQELVRRMRRSKTRWPVLRAELWGARYHPLLTGTLATRAYLKQQNFAAENLLEKYAEPLAAMAAARGCPYPARLLDEAWKLLFLNHAHDGIHGSSCDEAHVEMMQRFGAVRQIAAGIAHTAIARLAPPAVAPATREHILAFNPVSAGAQPLVLDFWLNAPDGNFHLVDAQGRAIPWQFVENPPAPARPRPKEYCHLTPDTNARRLLAQAAIPAHGLAVLAIVPGRQPRPPALFKNGPQQIENEFLRVRIRRGRLSIFDKQARRWHRNLNILEDEADAGDAWDFSPPGRPGRILRGPPAGARCRLEEDGPVRATLRLDFTMRIPAGLEGNRRSRTQEAVKAVLRVSLPAGARHAALTLDLDNRCRDHRLRWRCATGLHGRVVKSQGHFGIIRRPLRNPPAGRRWKQPPPRTFPFREWLAVEDGRFGLALAGRGMYEYEARPGRSGVDVYVTLFRAVGCMNRAVLKTRPGDGATSRPIPGAQCPGLQRFEYALVPYALERGEAPPGCLEAVRAFLFPPIVSVSSCPAAAPAAAPLPAPLFNLAPANLVVSCFKRSEDGRAFILRFWENAGQQTNARLRLAPFFKRVQQVDLREKPVRPLGRPRAEIRFPVKPCEIVTLKLTRA